VSVLLKFRLTSIIFGIMLTFGLNLLPATASEDLLKQGITEYNAGDFGNAAGHLGAALSTDFNNPILHYYLGNTYVRLKQKEGAIREFRIAYALQPDAKVGEYSKSALALLGASVTEGEAPVPPKMPASNDFPHQQFDPMLEKALSAIGDQGKNIATFRNTLGQSSADGLNKSNADALKRLKDQMLQDATRYGRRGTVYPATNPSPDDQRKLDALKHDYDSRNQRYLDNAAREAAEIQNSARNLQTLLNDQPKQGELKLNPAGTNLYIRNYQAPDPGNQSPARTQPQVQTQPVKSNPGNH
jgi:tetratricopeptide (TPR) repeat protein